MLVDARNIVTNSITINEDLRHGQHTVIEPTAQLTRQESNEYNSTQTMGGGLKDNSPGTLNRGSTKTQKEVPTVSNNMNFSKRLFIIQVEDEEN